MTAFDASYFDGVSTLRRPVRVEGGDGRLSIRGDNIAIDLELSAITVDAPLGELPRVLRLPGDAQLQTADHAAIAALFPRAQRFEGWVRRLERHWGAALEPPRSARVPR